VPSALPAPGGYPPNVLFDIAISERDGWAVLAVTGELDVATAPKLRQEAVRMSAAGQHRVVLDLSGVGFLDSTGLGVIVGILKRSRTNGGELLLAGAEPQVRKVFEITRMNDILPLHDSVDDAIASAGP
jgi:anti-sigma B factor antagonist